MAFSANRWLRLVGWDERRILNDALQSAEPLLRRRAKTVMDTIRSNVSTEFPPASEAGEFPHLRSGDFRDSFRIDRIGLGEYSVATDSPYALHLEFGRPGHTAARPSIRRSLLQCRDLFTAVEIHR
jgi:hypothetical protein